MTLGQQVQAKLIEAIDTQHWIVSFQGQLLQVTNHTHLKFKSGVEIPLTVTGLNPLQFTVSAPKEQAKARINRRI